MIGVSARQDSLWSALIGLWRRRELIWFLTLDALRKQVPGAVLGLWWLLVKPLLVVGLYAFVFTVVFRPAQGSAVGAHDYIVILLSGMVPWLLLSEPLIAASGSIASNAPLLNKVMFPVEVFPVSRVLGALVPGLVMLGAVSAILLQQGRLGGWAGAVLLAVLVEMIFVMGLAWGVAAVCVTVPDFRQALPFLLNVWFFASPVVYLPAMVPVEWVWLTQFNPMWPVIGVFRSLLMENVLPSAGQVGIMSLWAGGSFLGGYLLFLKRRAMFADLV